MSTTTAKGVPVPELTDPPNGPADLLAVAQWVDAHPGISTLTYAQINALSGSSELWIGRVVFQSDTGVARPKPGLYRYGSGGWTDAITADYWVSLTSSSTNADADGAWNRFNWSVAEDDDDLSSGTVALTVPPGGGGLWVIEFGVRWASNGNGSRQMQLICSGAGTLNYGVRGATNTSLVAITSRTIRLVSGETVQAERRQDGGGSTLALAPTDGLHFFTARRVHP